jgi:hypothetical protein
VERVQDLGLWFGYLGAVLLGELGALIGARRGCTPTTASRRNRPGIAVAQAFGRWGSWFNQRLFGRGEAGDVRGECAPVTKLEAPVGSDHQGGHAKPPQRLAHRYRQPHPRSAQPAGRHQGPLPGTGRHRLRRTPGAALTR